MEFFYGIYKQGNEVLLAICDENIIDMVFHNNDKMIKIDVKKSFYGKNKGCKEDILELMKNATILNLVGKDIIEIAIEEGIINKECVLAIGETVHAQRAKM
ncbi:MAG: hypothetical protein AMQ74_00928 [Candidatus Methanofastidiosum methylothiophilum]|uniref:DUF424 domain-containing protein n=1 Tax=Candidatus Methanofastidiosum methylothiophilum TaxID=1705564 RepID=A0A150J457_9EURY|nr:MAG: hypothetical protein AMQ74_00928 [Candidatus Methanofastidiosum methylthiophilus]NMC77239.1 DUF424 family protein [Candidatus Methanofastidiosa archaeon]